MKTKERTKKRKTQNRFFFIRDININQKFVEKGNLYCLHEKKYTFNYNIIIIVSLQSNNISDNKNMKCRMISG